MGWKTAIADNTSGGPNPTAWSNYKNSQAGDNTAEITFQYATQQVLGEVTVHFFKDSASARYPKAGTTKLYVNQMMVMIGRKLWQKKQLEKKMVV